MDTNQLKRNICRICLHDNVFLDWNTSLYQYYDTTYKDCYYKYSQLERYATDPFPTMLCQDCSTALYNTHMLILKALESHKLLQNELSLHGHTFGDSCFTPAEFETVLVEKIEVEPIIDDHFKYDEDSDEEIIAACIVPAEQNQQIKETIVPGEKLKIKAKVEHPVKAESEIEKPIKEALSQSLDLNTLPTKRKRKSSTKIKSKKTVDVNKSKEKKELKEKPSSKEEKHLEGDLTNTGVMHGVETNEEEAAQIDSNVKKKYKETKKPRMCSICSKILHNKYSVQMHEKTHIENRERKETCKVCGLKFYDKRNLYSHMRIHKENREKRHKCEFCSKAFYDKGGLNIHRRVHLGQMVPCSLCSKQYFRQIDLERHMSTHSATTINSDTKKRSRYLVRCKYCDKSILSTSFKSHTAAHLNEPLMKCLVCGKEFFRRGSCVLHVKKVHQKNNDEYNDFIAIYKKNRISHLFLEQKADIQANMD